jgi:hypothetical protein
VLAARIALRRASNRAAHKGLLGRLGPGLITGASDDDPSGIAAYACLQIRSTSVPSSARWPLR